MNAKTDTTKAFHAFQSIPFNILRLIVGTLALLGILLPCANAGPTLETVYSFNTGPANPSGKLIQAVDGNFYGVTQYGGSESCGTIFRMTPAGAVKTLVSFSGNNGQFPNELIQGSDGNFYGTTQGGGIGFVEGKLYLTGNGTVFKMTPAGVLTTLVEFTGSGVANKGANPQAALTLGSDGNFYGTTQRGTVYGYGTIFKMTPAGELNTLVTFTNNSEAKGYWPHGKLARDTSGDFFGTTLGGGASNVGTVFKVTPDGVLTTLVEFTNDGDTNKGSLPYAGLLKGNDGNFYGTTSRGGASDHGTIFKMTSAGVLTTLVEFTRDGLINKGASPKGMLIQATDGNFYGTTEKGSLVGSSGDGKGTVFKMTPSGLLTTLVDLRDFHVSGSRWLGTAAGLTQGSDGDFYGTTINGGISNSGVVFRMAADGTVTTLVEFDWASSGANPQTDLVLAKDGKFYGTAARGGPGYNPIDGYVGNGNIFKISSHGALTRLVSFDPFTGENPQTPLVQGIDGNFYGTSTYGGGFTQSNFPFVGSTFYPAEGTLFKMTSAGAFNTLLLFGKNESPSIPLDSGENPGAGLAKGADDNFYGTTTAGGANGFGKIFRTTTTGDLTTLVDFTGTDGTNKGSDPQGELLLASGGNYFGTTNAGGASDLGTVFRMTPAGALATLVEFTGDGAANKGANPQAALIQGTNGKFYGTTTAGGAGGFGTIFRMTSAGVLTTLVQFTGNGATNKGASPHGALLEGADGNFYGTTLKGGTYDAGTVFMMTPFGTLTTLVHFRPQPSARGAYPYAGLVKGTDNNFYGTTEQGGAGGGGTVFRLRFGPTPETKTATGVASTTAILAGRVNPRGLATTVSFQIGTKRTFGGASTMFVTTLPAGTTFKSLSLPVSGLAPNTKYYFRIVAENPDNSVPQTGKTYSFTTLP